jgi:hypothetical protein
MTSVRGTIHMLRRHLTAVLVAFIAVVASTSASRSDDPAWKGPGWYDVGLDPIVGEEWMIYAGPYSSQDQCEAAKTDKEDSCRYLATQADADRL